MPNIRDDLAERIRILEKAVALLGDATRKRSVELEEGQRDIVRELKSLKLFLGRNMAEFRRQFPEIHRKVK